MYDGDFPWTWVIVVVLVIGIFAAQGCWAHKCAEAGGEVASYRGWVCVKKGTVIDDDEVFRERAK